MTIVTWQKLSPMGNGRVIQLLFVDGQRAKGSNNFLPCVGKYGIKWGMWIDKDATEPPTRLLDTEEEAKAMCIVEYRLSRSE
jgi:hypothetical protein